MTSKADKLSLETEPVARDNNTILTLKPGDQTLSRLTQLIIVVNTTELGSKFRQISIVALEGLLFSVSSQITHMHSRV